MPTFNKTPTYEVVDPDDCYVPLQQSDNLAHQNAIPQVEPTFDGRTIEEMHNNPSFKQGYDPIDLATMCRDKLVADKEVNERAAENYTQKIKKALSGSQFKNPFDKL